MNALLLIAVAAVIAVAGYQWYRGATRKWTWQAVETICMGVRVRLTRRFQTRYNAELAPRIASAVIARLLPLQEGLPHTWNTLSMAREAPSQAVESELKKLDIDESVRRGIVYAAYGVFHVRRSTASLEAAEAFLADLERKGVQWRDIPIPHSGEFMEFATRYMSESVGLVASDAFAHTDRDMADLLREMKDLSR